MAEKLFYKNAYLKECEAEVVNIIDEGDKVKVVLDQTIFYPEGGGQPSDIGEIDGIKVTYVSEKLGVIYHHMESAPINKKVKCAIDFERRFDHMQQHSGEHMLSGAVLTLFNGNNKGFHLGDDYVTIDIDIEEIKEDMIEKLENKVNDYIYTNKPIDTYIVSKEESEDFPLRKQIHVDGEIRVVKMEEVDCCPCCGTHVSKTGEIGLIKIIKTEKYKGMTRIYFKCGKRALIDFQKKHKVITTLSKMLSVEKENIAQRVESQKEEIQKLLKEVNSLKKIFAKKEAENIIKNSSSKVLLRRYDHKNFEDIQLIVSELSAKEYIYILYSTVDKKIVVINNYSSEINAGKLFKDNIKEFNGRGGGNAKRSQGTFETEEDIIKFAEFLFNEMITKVE